jgi:DNA polymerase III sliding clamp (beta) subunit (PCNA family)
MKFKLNKSDHLQIFNLLNKFEKTKLNIKENANKDSNSIVFYSSNKKFHAHVDTIFCQSNWSIMDTNEEFSFSFDLNVFYNAFHNFPSDDIQFVYSFENNSLVFGNKKTRVAIKTTPCSKPLDISLSNLDSFNCNSFIESLRYTTFSCSNDVDDYPYNSINISFGSDICAQSSDKHRISLFGDVDFDNSYVVSKSSADIISLYISTIGEAKYSIHQSKLFLSWDSIYLVVSLGSKSEANVFKTLKNFKDSKRVAFTNIDKSDLSRSIKFISSITNSLKTEFNFEKDKLTLSSESNDKGAVVDTIALDNLVEPLKVSYLSSHLLKILDLLPEKEIHISLLDFNNFTLMSLTSDSYTHILFPME